MSTRQFAQVKLNGVVYPIYTDQEAGDVVDQLIYAADEAGWTPDANLADDLTTWAEDAALVLIARSPEMAPRDTVVVMHPENVVIHSMSPAYDGTSERRFDVV